jgi:hypothetical protein
MAAARSWRLARRTLFIVGAGGSFDFGFPIGSGLVAEIHHHLVNRHNDRGYAQGDTELIDAMLFASQSKRIDMRLFYDAGVKLANILSGRPVSIDNVVHTHRSDLNLVTVAKLAIARIILSHEKSSFLNLKEVAPLKSSAVHNENWLSFVFSRHFAGFEISELMQVFDRIRFISFNYDRCIGQVARRSLASNFQLEDGPVFPVMEKLQVHHPYGSLGDLPNVATGGDFGFGQNLNDKRIFNMSLQIRTFSEGLSDKPLHNRILESIFWAEHIVFVGFGYLGLNMKLLEASGIVPGSKVVFGSAYKMSSTAAVEVKASMSHQFASSPAYGFDVSQDATAFLWEMEKKLFQ